MPDIVTIRILNTYADKSTEIYYIEKNGGVKSFISDEYYDTQYGTVDQIKDKIDQNQSAEIVNIVDIHNLIEFYNTLMLIDNDDEMTYKYYIITMEDVKRKYTFDLYGIKSNSEIIRIAKGHARNPIIHDSQYGNEALDLYLLCDPFNNLYR